ncbi:MAG: rod shape-determining protein MreD [Candidatus Hydromicrobium sp.]
MKTFFRILHFFILIICLLLQIVFFENLKSFSVDFDLIMVVIIAITLFDGVFWGMLFGFIVGMVLDIMVGSIVGISAFIYSMNAFMVDRLITAGFRYKLLTYSFIVFLITEINILIVSLIRYLFNFDSNLLRMGLELVTKPVCNIILMFIIFPIISSGTKREIELGFKYKNKI